MENISTGCTELEGKVMTTTMTTTMKKGIQYGLIIVAKLTTVMRDVKAGSVSVVRIRTRLLVAMMMMVVTMTMEKLKMLSLNPSVLTRSCRQLQENIMKKLLILTILMTAKTKKFCTTTLRKFESICRGAVVVKVSIQTMITVGAYQTAELMRKLSSYVLNSGAISMCMHPLRRSAECVDCTVRMVKTLLWMMKWTVTVFILMILVFLMMMWKVMRETVTIVTKLLIRILMT